MNITELTRVAEIVVIIASVSGVGILWNTIKTYKESNEALKERLEIVAEETKTCHDQHKESLQFINQLRGELNAYKELSLIPKDFIKELQRNQKEIIKLIKGTK
mgnify:CR=1 FL=1